MYAVYLIVIQVLFPQIIAEVKTYPKDLIRVQGDSTILHCVSSTSSPSDLLQWKHLKPGASAQDARYVYFEGRFFEQYDEGRHGINLLQSPKTCDLNITSLTLGDAGTYICASILNGTDQSAIELTVLESPPHCGSNISLSNVLVDNDCDLMPDYFDLNCSVGYHGKVAPVLLWSHSSHPDIVLSTSNSQPQSNKVTSLSHPIKPAYHMNETFFICSVEGLEFDKHEIECATQKITINYIFSPKASAIISSPNHLTCIANTSSQHCEYRWRGTHVTSNGSFESYDQILEVDDHINNLRCVTKCEIHSQKCDATSSQVMPEISGNSNGFMAWKIFLIVMAIPVVVLTVACIIKRYFPGFLECFRKQKDCPDGEIEGLLEEDLKVSGSDIAKDFIQQKISKLVECLDAVNGLADKLYSKGLLTEEDCYQFSNVSSYESSARDLLNMLQPKMDGELERKSFLEALLATDQRHVYEYLMETRESDPNTSVRILDELELNCLQRNYPCLLTLIKSSDSFLDKLVRGHCITGHQKDRIKQYQGGINRNRELLAIMRRRSFAHFEAFKDVLKKNNQIKVVDLLNQLAATTLPLHCILQLDGHPEDVAPTEIRISETINNTHQLSWVEQREISTEIETLTANGVEFASASPTGSIYCYFVCKTFQAVIYFKSIYESGELIRILTSLFDRIMKKSSIQLTLEVWLEEKVYEQSIGQVRYTMYYNEAEKKITRPPLLLIPDEISMMILQKSFVRSWSMQLSSYAPENIRAGGYALFEKFVRNKGTMVYMDLKSVFFKWKGICSLQCLFRLAIKKRFLQCKEVFIQHLNCHYGLLDSLVIKGVINDEEKNEIMQTETKKKLIPAHMSESNERLIACILNKEFSKMKRFLKELDTMNLGHILNYLFCCKKLRVFEECWPIDNVMRDCIAKCKSKLKVVNISEKTFGYVSSIRGSEILPRGMNLLEILCYQRCISPAHKCHIQEQKTVDLQKVAFLQMLTTGSIKAYQTTVAYMRDTDQYVELVQHILVPGGKEITKVAWLENKIYVAFYKSSIIYVYSDEEPFVRLEEEEIDISGILLPYDIAACSKNRIIYISDRVNKTLWKILLAEGDQSPQLSKRPVNGEPIDLFVMSSGDLLLTVEHETQRRLEIYSPEDFNRPKMILISKDVHHAWHAVQLSTGTFVVASRSVGTLQVGRAYFLQEISAEGEVLRKFESIYENESITPFHLSVDTKDNILFGDALKKAVYILDPDWRELKMLLTEEKHGVKEPERLCFVPEKNLLVIGNRASRISIFNLHTHSV